MSVGHTLGVSFTGLLFNMAYAPSRSGSRLFTHALAARLYGAACIQFMYYLGKGRSPSDSWQLPVFVSLYVLMIVTITHMHV